MSNNEILFPLDTSEIKKEDSIQIQKERAAHNKFKRALAANKRCWNCSMFSYCSGEVSPGRVCSVIRNDETLQSIYKKYKELRTKGLKIREKRNMKKNGKKV